MSKSLKKKTFVIVASTAMVMSLFALPANVHAEGEKENKKPYWDYHGGINYHVNVEIGTTITPEEMIEKANLKAAIRDDDTPVEKITIVANQWDFKNVNFSKIGSYRVPCTAVDDDGNETSGNVGVYVDVVDTTVPKAYFIQDGKAVDIGENVHTNENVSLKFFDNGALGYYVLNGNKVELAKVQWQDGNYENIKGMLKEGDGEAGKNVLTVWDTLKHSTEYTFYIDQTTPKVKLEANKDISSGYVKDNVILKLYSSESLDTTSLGGTWKRKELDKDGYKYVYEKAYTANVGAEQTFNVVINAKDLAGNTAEEVKANFVVDKKVPEFVSPKNGHQYQGDIKVEIKETHFDKVEVYNYNTKETTTITDQKFVLDADAKYSLTAYDKAGNNTKIYVSKDSKAPVIRVIGKGNGNHYRDIEAIAIFDGKEANLTTLKINNETIDLNKAGYVYLGKDELKGLVEGENKLVATDMAGNETVLTFIYDTTKPEITDFVAETYSQKVVADKGLVNEDVLLKAVAKDNIGVNRILYSNKTTGKWTTFKTDDPLGRPYAWLTEEGVYKLLLRVEDKAGNYTEFEKVLEFEIDKTAPEIKNIIVETQSGNAVKDGGLVNESVILNIEANDKNGIRRVLYLDKATEKWTTFDTDPYGRPYTWLTKDGEYNLVLRVEDKAGNYTDVERTFEIDKTAPEIKNVIIETQSGKAVKNGEFVDENVVLSVEANDKNEIRRVLYLDKSTGEWVTFDKDDLERFYTWTQKEGIYNLTLRVEDKAGNYTDTDVLFGIDKTAALAGVEYSETNPTQNDVTVTLTVNEGVVVKGKGWVLGEGENVFTKVFTENASEKVVLVDRAGNETEVEVVVNNIDRVAPEAEVTYSTTEPTDKDVVATIKANEEVTLVGKGWVYNSEKDCYEKVITENGEETVVVVDRAGNEAEVRVSVKNIKKAAPIVTPDPEEKPTPTPEQPKPEDKTEAGVQTDDENNAMLYASVAGLALVGGVIVVLNKKREDLMK